MFKYANIFNRYKHLYLEYNTLKMDKIIRNKNNNQM